MRVHRGAALAAGLLCAVAATVALWSGPLLRASSALHSAPGAPSAASTASAARAARATTTPTVSVRAPGGGR